MENKIRIGITGYGNLGRGVEQSIRQNPDMELQAVFTRRDPASLTLATPGVPVVSLEELDAWAGRIDVMILCGGSAKDLPVQGPAMAKLFNTVDSFDTHPKIPEYFARMDEAACGSRHVSILSVGWDPGLFSLNRLYAEAVLPEGSTYTFWGKGVSQGHSNAVRRLPGVVDAIQYTIPLETALEQVRSGSRPELTARDKHLRECFVVAEEGADRAAIEKAIKTMPDYFADYDTVVHFITLEELKRDHSRMAHGGFVIRSGSTADGESQVVEYSLRLGSNPSFTSSVLVAYARAAWRLAQKQEFGARTVLDVAPALLSPKTGDELRRSLV